MSEQNIFEQASRLALRFSSPKGDLTTEQLWKLPLTSVSGLSLDGLAVAANRALREQAEDSFVEVKANPLKAQLTLQLEILKHIINVRQAESKAASDAVEKKAEAQRLREILAKRDGEKLESLSEAQIQERLKQLEG